VPSTTTSASRDQVDGSVSGVGHWLQVGQVSGGGQLPPLVLPPPVLPLPPLPLLPPLPPPSEVVLLPPSPAPAGSGQPDSAADAATPVAAAPTPLRNSRRLERPAFVT
jgi:hypothetical protein